MDSEKLSSRPTRIYTGIVRVKKTGNKSFTYYLPITREDREKFGFIEGESITFGILQRIPPLVRTHPHVSDTHTSSAHARAPEETTAIENEAVGRDE